MTRFLCVALVIGAAACAAETEPAKPASGLQPASEADLHAAGVNVEPPAGSAGDRRTGPGRPDPAAKPADLPPTPGTNVPLEPAPSSAEVVPLDGATVALVNRAIELYQEFVTLVAKHPSDCVALERDLRGLVAKYKGDILRVQKLQTTLEPKQLKAAQKLMTAGLPPSFISDLMATDKRCASSPGFAETLGNLQGKAKP